MIVPTDTPTPKKPRRRKTAAPEVALRALHFLCGVRQNPPAQVALARFGYTQAEHDLGCKLLMDVCGHGQALASGAAQPSDADAAKAIEELDARTAALLSRAEAAVRRVSAEVADVLFGGAAGADAAARMTSFLERVDAVAARATQGTGGNGAETKALAVLAERGIDAAERRRLAALVTRTRPGAAPTPSAAVAPTDGAAAAIGALAAWLGDWSATARAELPPRLARRIGVKSMRPRTARPAKTASTPAASEDAPRAAVAVP